MIDARTSHELLEEGFEEALPEVLGDRRQPLQNGRQQGMVQREVPDPRRLADLEVEKLSGLKYKYLICAIFPFLILRNMKLETRTVSMAGKLET